ncbi:hypothetical protein HOF78_04055 [Candidatus Woesearchaeota archaeon]|jgi:mRNA-degrading endonuclease RelE of RelBE toxin-antitoxin system|nr:hypothetical protein [Candidatus Woesearchaeota archaeon]MBT6044465.1 hypothetical protein [Candidatus Woesearchaeota archaeon]
MKYSLEIKSSLDKIFSKLDKFYLRSISNKVEDICSNPFKKYKFLRKPLNGFNRVHLNKHFVLIFRIDHFHQSVTLFHYAHHDEVYFWRSK